MRLLQLTGKARVKQLTEMELGPPSNAVVQGTQVFDYAIESDTGIQPYLGVSSIHERDPPRLVPPSAEPALEPIRVAARKQRPKFYPWLYVAPAKSETTPYKM